MGPSCHHALRYVILAFLHQLFLCVPLLCCVLRDWSRNPNESIIILSIWVIQHSFLYYTLYLYFVNVRSWHWFRRTRLCRDYESYSPHDLVKESDLDPRNNYIIGSHPHGMLASGAFCYFGTEGTIKKTKVCKISNVRFPLFWHDSMV